MSDRRKLKPPRRPRPLPLKLALGLGTTVLLVHLWLLASAPLPLSVQAGASPAALSFSTRRIELPGPAPAAAARPAAAPPSRAASGRPAARPPPAPATAPAAETAASPAAVPPQPAEPAGAQATAREPEGADPAAQAQAQAQALALPPAAPGREAAGVQTHLPGSVRLGYELSGQSRGLRYSADGLMTWQQDGQRYEARMVISGLLLLQPRIMSSIGELGPQGVAPRRFSDKTRSEQATHFQPEQGRVVFSSNAPQAAWQPGMQDRLSIFFQLAGMLASEPGRFAPGVQVQVPTAGTREADTWTFTVVGKATLALPAGEQATLALRREPRREYDQTIEIWFAPALGYLPVRIRITQANGDVLDQRLASAQPL